MILLIYLGANWKKINILTYPQNKHEEQMFYLWGSKKKYFHKGNNLIKREIGRLRRDDDSI